MLHGGSWAIDGFEHTGMERGSTKPHQIKQEGWQSRITYLCLRGPKELRVGRRGSHTIISFQADGCGGQLSETALHWVGSVVIVRGIPVFERPEKANGKM